MENNDKTTGTPKSPTTPTRTTGPRAKSPNSSHMRAYLMQDLPQQRVNDRFNITPESMGLERRTDSPTAGQEEQITPKADFKSYERQFILPSIARTSGHVNFNNPGTLHSTQTNLYTSVKQDHLPPLKTLPMSSPPALESQHSDFYNSLQTQNVPQQRAFSLPQTETEQTSLFNKPRHRRLNSEQPMTSAGNYPNSDSLNFPSMTSLTGSLSADNPQCSHPAHSTLQTRTSLSEIPTSHFEQYLQKSRSESTGNSSQMNGRLNEMFLKRLQDIDTNAFGDVNVS